MKNHTQVAVTGMHGKTSTTAMTAAVLRAGNLDPTVVVGSVWDGVGSNAVLGRGDVFRGRVRRVRRLLCPPLPRDHHHHQPGPGAPGLLPGPGPRPRDVCGVFAAAAGGGQGHRLRRRPAPGPDPRRLPPGAGHLQPEAGESRFLCHRSDASGVGVPLPPVAPGRGLGDRHPAPGGVALRFERHGRLRRGEPSGPGVPGLAAGA